MSKFREPTISNCEKKFLIQCLDEWTRIDGRAFEEFRDVVIKFGKDWGSCYVELGQTKVLAQVSCEVVQPKSSRPSEGVLNINVELNPMSAPYFEAGRQSELSVQLNRLLEKCIKDSKTLDLESLCIKVNEKVWAFRLDVNVLNHEGNILDCASIASLSALAHFRRPDVTFEGEDFIVHNYRTRDPIPTVIHHYPVCVSYAVFENGTVLADPSFLEESVAETHLTIGLNAYKELCSLHLGGKAQVDAEVILATTRKAADRAAVVVAQIKSAIEQDKENRENVSAIGFQHILTFDEDVSTQQLISCLDTWKMTEGSKKKRKPVKTVEPGANLKASVLPLGTGSAVLLPKEGTMEVWDVSSEDESEVEEVKIENKEVKSEVFEIDSDGSEEEKVIVLNANKITRKRNKKQHK